MIPRALGVLLLMAPTTPAQAAPGALAPGVGEAVAEASQVSGLPPEWIFAVISRESGGRPKAVSPRGAMGLMQLMPATWHELRLELGLGPDPFEVRDNVMAGAVYLREMLERFGRPGFLAAYNAGPGRYAQALAGRAALPRETRRYEAGLAAAIGVAAPGAPPRPLAATSSGLFPLAARPGARGDGQGSDAPAFRLNGRSLVAR